MSITLYKILSEGSTPSHFPQPLAPQQTVAHGDQVKLVRLPGGEWHVTGEPLFGLQLAYVQGASADDLVAMAIWADAVRRDRGTPYLLMPYLPGGRQDRRLPGEALSAAVYADLINSYRCERVVCFDPHSDVMPALINNCVVVPPTKVVSQALALNAGEKIDAVISPDAGAAKRATLVAEALGVPVFHAVKQRDAMTKQASSFRCERLPAEGRFLVVDDICDGGGTPKGLAEAIQVPKERLALWVSHGIFSGNAAMLGAYYSAIYTTDSHEGSSMERHLLRKQAGANQEFIIPVFPILLRYL